MPGRAPPVLEARVALHVVRLESRTRQRGQRGSAASGRRPSRLLADHPEQLQRRRGRELEALAVVEPEELAREAEVDRDRPAQACLERVRRHRPRCSRGSSCAPMTTPVKTAREGRRRAMGTSLARRRESSADRPVFKVGVKRPPSMVQRPASDRGGAERCLRGDDDPRSAGRDQRKSTRVQPRFTTIVLNESAGRVGATTVPPTAIRTGSGSAMSFWITTTVLPSWFTNASWLS